MIPTTLRDYLQNTEDALSAGRINDALSHCQYILSYFPEALEAQRLLGEIHMAQGHLDEAQQTFDWVLTNDPENVIAYCNRALICERLSDIDTALDCYQQAYELSRGNSHIRQEFNLLSSKAGQQGFMFSRAGLARLYMRGDLLSQATQEWEAVLANSPERLDARTGLLESCWREGNYEQAEQLATRLLEDVPSCLKALLLLAHMRTDKNLVQAKELLHKAEALDPEMVMAQELFSDLIASQPNSPFLSLLKREPVLLQPPSEQKTAETRIPVESLAATKTNGNTPIQSVETIFGWSSPDTLKESEKDYQPAAQDQIASPDQSNETTLTPEAWNTFGSSPGIWSQNDVTADSWQAQLGNTPNASPTGLPEPPTIETEPAAPPAWLDTLTKSERNQPSGPIPPLNAPQEPAAKQLTPAPEPSAAQIAPATGHAQPASEPEDIPPFPFAFEDSDAEMGWPEWLKSLGAEAIDGTTPAEPAAQIPQPAPATNREEPAVRASHLDIPQPAHTWGESPTSEPLQTTPVAQPQQQTYSWAETEVPAQPQSPQPEQQTYSWAETEASVQPQPAQPEPANPWLDQLTYAQPAQPETANPWLDQLAQAQPAQPETASPWLDQLAYAQPAQPETASPWLDQLAYAQPAQPETANPWGMPAAQGAQPEPTTPWLDQLTPSQPSGEDRHLLKTLENLEHDLRSQGFVPLEPGALSSLAQETQSQEPTLSSPLSQLGGFERPTPPSPSAEVMPPAQPTTIPIVQPIEPLWPATPQPVSRPTPTPIAPAQVPGKPRLSDSAPLPAYRADALLENELETTMKRPAFRLQPVQRGSSPQEPQPPRGKAQATERSTQNTAPASGDLGSRDRLLKGYQYQLAGAYDDAMQEYRIIIRNAPEVIGEVISNTRALLKLAPKYSAGYRVLGDAYMRQGEYLQAMEAYNKALTMAKKAKGQGN